MSNASRPARFEPLEPRRHLAVAPVAGPFDAPVEVFTADPVVTALAAEGHDGVNGSARTARAQSPLATARNLAFSRYADFAQSHAPTQFADYTAVDGSWLVGTPNTWVAGFTPGVFWQLDSAARAGGSPTRAWAMRGEQWARRLANSPAWAEDVGFRMMAGLEPWRARLAAAGRGAEAEVVAQRMESEGRLKNDTRWNETVGAYRTAWRQSTNPEADYGVLMDQTYDLVLLQWLANRVAASDPALAQSLRTRVGRHITNVADYLVRPDGSSFHWGYFNRAGGHFVQGETYQGYADDSTWARGQAWGIWGFSEVARRAQSVGGAGDEATLVASRNAATRMADWYLAHLPADGVPFWDFDAPDIPNTPRDSSAAAIAAAGLLSLAGVRGLTVAQSAAYRSAGQEMLLSLATDYTSGNRHERSVLIHGVGNLPAGVAVDRGLIYGDYFFLGALNHSVAATVPVHAEQEVAGRGPATSLFSDKRLRVGVPWSPASDDEMLTELSAGIGS